MGISNFEELMVWQKSKVLCLAIYEVTRKAPFSKDFALRDQIVRAGISIMSNIAEGFERYHAKDFKRLLSIARGSAAEVRSHLHIAHGVGYLSDPQFQQLTDSCREISRMIAALHRKI